MLIFNICKFGAWTKFEYTGLKLSGHLRTISDWFSVHLITRIPGILTLGMGLNCTAVRHYMLVHRWDSVLNLHV